MKYEASCTASSRTAPWRSAKNDGVSVISVTLVAPSLIRATGAPKSVCSRLWEILP
ncbi:hypothetical protein D3C80_2196790 [compost metagenome]